MKISNVKMLPLSNANSNWKLATLALATLATLATLTSFALPLTWRADWPDAKPVETLVHRGTDVELQPLWRINKQPADTNGWTFTTWCQTNAVGRWFGPLPGAFFSHTNDVGAAFYNVMVRAETPGGAVNYTAFARLRMLDSPGFAPGVLPLPAQSIDFADVTVFNAPWATPADVAEATAPLADASNVYTKAETDALIASATPEDYDAVRAQVGTNAADIAALGTNKADKAELSGYLPLTSPYADFTFGDTIHIKGDMTINTGSLAFGADSNLDVTEHQGFMFQHFGSMSTLLPDGSPVLTRDAAPVQSVNSQTGAVALTAADVGAATPVDVYRIVAGTNVVLVVTNYNSTVHAPSMKLQHLDPETGEYVTYWDETRGHANTLTNAMNYADDLAAALDAAKAPRAWSRVTSGLGADAPEGTTFISTPVTHISGGFEFEKKITAGGTVWTLCSTSLAAGSTTNGYFEISALDGTPVFSVEKTDSVLVGVDASAIDVVGSTCVISVPAVADTHPFARVATTLVQPTWYKEDSDGMPAGSPATVSWSGQSGAWVATVDFGSSPQGFVFFEYLQEGRVKIVNSAVVDLSQGVHYGGATYMPTVSGNELKFIRQQ